MAMLDSPGWREEEETAEYLQGKEEYVMSFDDMWKWVRNGRQKNEDREGIASLVSPNGLGKNSKKSLSDACPPQALPLV